MLGGSIAGLCAAGALAPHFDEVLVLERDELPADAEHRRGVPQSKHPHFLLNSGRRAISDALPRLRGRPDRRRWAPPDAVDGRGLPRGRRLGAAQAGVDDDGLQLTDPHRAGAARQGARAGQRRHPRGRLGQRARDDRRAGVAPEGRVTGVAFSTSADGDERIDADLVVDAMGRGSSVVRLARGGRLARDRRCRRSTPRSPTPRGGTTYRLPTDRPASWWWQHLVIMPTQDKGEHPAEHEFLVNFFPIEGNRAIACMGSWGIEMPRTAEDFVDVGRTACGRRCSLRRWRSASRPPRST